MQPEPLVPLGEPQASVDPADDLADAHRAIAYAGTWVNNADTKAGLLAAAVAVVVAATTQQSDSIGDVLRPVDGGEWFALILLALVGSALAVAIVCLALVVTPRTPPSQIPSRFGFPTLASDDWTQAPATREQAAREAWSQAHVLSRIAKRKFRALRAAAVAAFALLALYAGWAVAASLIE